MLPIFPAHLLNPDTVAPGIDRRVISGGVALSGIEDMIATDGGGRVTVTYGDMAADNPQTQRILNAWDAYLASGAAACLVPLVTLATAPRRWVQTEPDNAFGFGGDDPLFPTSVGYRVRSIAAVTVGSAALRATTLTIRISKGSPIVGGEWFSIGERAHRIERVLSRSGMDFTCRINPPLRSAVPASTAVEFEWPVVRARISPGTSLIPATTFGLFGDVGATFLEVL